MREETYMGGLRKLLYGRYRPEIFLRRYLVRKGQISQRLLAAPVTPEVYLGLEESLRDRWGVLAGSGLLKEWPSAYFYIPDSFPEPVHILSTFYRRFIRYELRMTTLSMMEKQADSSIPVEELRYELITVLELWINLLVECNDRIRVRKYEYEGEKTKGLPSDEVRIKCLQEYLWKLLIVNLETSIYEFQIRFPLIPKHRLVTRNKLYLKQFGQPVPLQTPYVRTVDNTHHELQHLFYCKDAPHRIDSLLAKVQFEMDGQSEYELRNILNQSLNLLQNARLFAGVKSSKQANGDRNLKHAAVFEADKHRLYLLHLAEGLKTGRELSVEEKEFLHQIMHSMNEYRAILMTGEQDRRVAKESEAVRLLRLIEHHFIDTDYSDSYRVNNEPYRSAKQSLLDMYLDMDEIINKLSVTPKTLKKYLDESGVEVIEFSTQRQLIHKEEVRKLLNYYSKLKK